MTAREWAVERHRATAAELHAIEVPAAPGRLLWLLEPTGPAVVLGSTQSADAVAAAVAAARGVEVARRRSGGGAVWVAPDDPIWVDVVVPHHDPLWTDDVARAFLPIGRAWIAALADVGVGFVAAEGAVGVADADPGGGPDRVGPGPLRVHEGPMRHTAWSASVCFSGTGPGEVVDASGAKVVGISQRRTRAAARFQCAVYRRWDPEPLRAVLADPPPAGALASAGRGVGDVDVDRLLAALAAALGRT